MTTSYLVEGRQVGQEQRGDLDSCWARMDLVFLCGADSGVSAIDWYAQCVRITGKGNKRRACPLRPNTLDELQFLVANRAPEQRLFLNRNGQPLTRFGIHTLVEHYASRACAQSPSLASKRVSPHVIRHTAATHLLRSGGDINTVRAWLGHVSLTKTDLYAETDLATKARALAMCAPILVT